MVRDDDPLMPRDGSFVAADVAGSPLSGIVDIVAAGAGSGPDDLYAGGVVAVADRGRLVLEAAVGHAQTHDGDGALDAPRPMRVDSILDLASITKVSATTAALMTLLDAGRVDLDDSIGDHVIEFADTEKAAITLRHLLTHRSGLWEWQPVYLHVNRRTEIPAFLADLGLRYAIGRERHYSDLGFMLLGIVIERVTGERLDRYVRAAVHEPLGMTDTFYGPDPVLRSRIAATSLGNPYERRMIATGQPYAVVGTDTSFLGWRDHTLVGEANDGNAWYACGGVAGHAGLFGTARDLVLFGQAMLASAHGREGGLASPGVARAFLRRPFDSEQALGFWAGRLSAVGAQGGYGHAGFTGTQFLFDPERDLVVVLLTNRQHPGEPYRSVEGVWHAVLRRVLGWRDEVRP